MNAISKDDISECKKLRYSTVLRLLTSCEMNGHDGLRRERGFRGGSNQQLQSAVQEAPLIAWKGTANPRMARSGNLSGGHLCSVAAAIAIAGRHDRGGR
jgi:hypothetical protein